MWRQSAVHNIGNTQPAVEEGLVFFSFFSVIGERGGGGCSGGLLVQLNQY